MRCTMRRGKRPSTIPSSGAPGASNGSTKPSWRREVMVEPDEAPDGRAGRPPSDVSVVVPTWNEAKSLPALLASLRTQTRPPREVLLADSGSTDGTADLGRAAGATGLPRGGRGAGGGRERGGRTAISRCGRGRDGIRAGRRASGGPRAVRPRERLSARDDVVGPSAQRGVLLLLPAGGVPDPRRLAGGPAAERDPRPRPALSAARTVRDPAPHGLPVDAPLPHVWICAHGPP